MPIGSVTSILLASALTVAITSAGHRLQSNLSQMETPQSDCGANPGAACSAIFRSEVQGSRCSLPADSDD